MRGKRGEEEENNGKKENRVRYMKIIPHLPHFSYLAIPDTHDNSILPYPHIARER